MNIKVVEYSIFVLSVTVIYLICDCRDLRRTNNLQDIALNELTKSLPLLVRTNIDSYHNNIENDINTEKEILKNESIDKKNEVPHQVTMKEDLAHHDKTKIEKSMNVNGGVSRKVSHRNYDKHRYSRDVPTTPTHDYKKSFDAANRIKNKKRKNMKEIWAKQNLFSNKSREAMKIHESLKDNNWKSLKQKQGLQERKKQLDRNFESRNLNNNDNVSTIIRRLGNNLKSRKGSQKKSSEGVEKQYVVENRRVESYMNEATVSKTSCVLTKAEIIPLCDDEYDDCTNWSFYGYCTNTMIMPDTDGTFKDWMIANCPKACDACPPLVPLFENQVQHEEDDNNATTFNLSLDVTTDDYAYETSWTFMSRNNEDSILFNSSEVDITSQLENNREYKFNYYCAVHPTEENQLTHDTTSTCYNFEVHDSHGDGICCEYGDGLFSMNIITNTNSLNIEDKFEDGSVISTSFCVGHDDGKIRSYGKFITTKQPSHYPFTNWQCKNGVCLCDSKPSLVSNIQENLAFMFEVTMLSDSDKLQDLESAQYKAACWVLYDDPFEYDLEDEGAHNRRMIQRYIMAVFYFATSPKKWEEHSNFLSSRSECDWNYYHDDGNLRGISCNEDDNVIDINLGSNNLDGTIVEELSGLRMLEYLYLGVNELEGTIPSMLGRLSELRHLYLGGNDLEGKIPPQLFNATNLEELYLVRNRLEGTIPETIGKLQKLSHLYLYRNNLSGSIPDALYSLENLKVLWLNENKLSSSISPLIGNLNKLEWLWLYNNMLTGQIPSTIGSLSSLEWLSLSNNRLSGSIPSTMENMISSEQLELQNNTLSGTLPESLFDLPNLVILLLQDNGVTGSVPDTFCERVDDYGYFFLAADCRNDVFDPELSCSCCLCKDESPILDGDCADATIKVDIDHGKYDSLYLEWSLTNDATGKKVLHDGPYSFENGLQSYEACVAYSDCFSFKQISPPWENTNYTIYWNDESIHDGAFQGFLDYDYYINEDDPFQTLLSFSYNEDNIQQASCYDIKLECYEEQPFLLQPNTTERIMYNQATKISNKAKIHDSSYPQSKALCWMLSNNHYDNRTNVSDTDIIQRYVLAILHFMSPDGLFGNDENLSEKHECDWNGITCKDNTTKIVTGISLTSENNQIINGTLINEIGSLQYLKVLEMNQTQLHGTIPRSFSNLWSLTKLNLSGNEISSTLPATLFRQLNKLEHIDLSDNTLRGSINDDIGSFSRILSLSLNENEITGSFPLEGFKYTDLEHLDISENKMNEIDFSLLSRHSELKTLDLSANFFAGPLPGDIFTSLPKLEDFNVALNDFSGTIPSTFPEFSNITHFDAHANRFKGPIPVSITELLSMQHLNLQGNKLTGSLPDDFNKLESLNTLVLSHNELKGSIPFDPMTLQNMERLHLHRNLLIGKAPDFNTITSYISDCGFPSDLIEPVECPTCNMCCNSIGKCQYKSPMELTQVHRTAIFFFVCIVTTIVSMILCRIWKNKIASNTIVSIKNALHLISDKSAYHFFLYKNTYLWLIGLLTYFFQVFMLFFFVHSADIANETSDREYTKTCPANSLECKESNDVDDQGKLVFCVVIGIWLLRDVIGSLKLMILSFQEKNPDFFVTSAIVFSVTLLSVWTSIYYVLAIATTNTELLRDAVVLLFVIEVDERVFQLVEIIRPDWVKKLNSGMDQEFYPDDMKEKFDQQQESQQNEEAMNRKPCRKNDLVLQSVISSFSSSFSSFQFSFSMNRSPSSAKERNQGDNPETNTEKQTNLIAEPNESVEQGSSPDNMEGKPSQDNEKNESCQENDDAVIQSSPKLSPRFWLTAFFHQGSSIDLEPNTEKPNNV